MSENAPISMNPTTLRIEDAAQILSKAGGRLVTEEMLRNDIDDGAPANADGTLNLVHYTAWLVKEMGRGD
ncbi:MAG: hypothetical protein IH899_14250 [Planctomycetes bacterium]|nr:hypothetical protein [Planctomycetota bacterium]